MSASLLTKSPTFNICKCHKFWIYLISRWVCVATKAGILGQRRSFPHPKQVVKLNQTVKLKTEPEDT